MAYLMRRLAVVPAVMIAAACGGEDTAVAESPAESTPAAAAPAPAAAAGELAPAPGGQVIEIKMTMTGGGRFEPSEVTASQGDVLRFVNVDNVHNIHFPAAKNPGASNLPAASQYLTAPGQTYEMVVEMGPGTYNFQCDPHVPMGMLGTLTVE